MSQGGLCPKQFEKGEDAIEGSQLAGRIPISQKKSILMLKLWHVEELLGVINTVVT